jgi:hypothetical protein
MFFSGEILLLGGDIKKGGTANPKKDFLGIFCAKFGIFRKFVRSRHI